ncbi:MAG: aldo/keto reductase [Paracoccaceae bacterium]
MKFLDHDIEPLGMGCWPIGGAMMRGEDTFGYANADDAESIRTIHAALDCGITLFDTAAAYGAGHAERLLSKALQGRSDVVIVSKIGIAIDEDTKQLLGPEISPDTVIPAIERCLSRLGRDCVDQILLHQNDLALPAAEAIFDEMEKARSAGKIRSYGWSTDFSKAAAAVAHRPGFSGVEHAMNVLVDAQRMQDVVHKNRLITLIRSPLAMGLLTGKYDLNTRMQRDDIRATTNLTVKYFENARANPEFLSKLDVIRDLLTMDGRSLTQGALCWLWGKNENNIPIPGARTVEQIEGIAVALAFGPLPAHVMADIEGLIERPTDDLEDREL